MGSFLQLSVLIGFSSRLRLDFTIGVEEVLVGSLSCIEFFVSFFLIVEVKEVLIKCSVIARRRVEPETETEIEIEERRQLGSCKENRMDEG